MKRLFCAAAVLLMTMGTLSTAVEAKPKQVPKVYIFGFSASFKNPVVYLTDIQELDSAWIDSKTKFLLGRDTYSTQLKEYLTQSVNDSHRTCVVMFSTEKAKAEKKYMKLKRTYTVKAKAKDGYDVKYLDRKDFSFETVDMSPSEEE
ncbi:MAG: hypothetical protein MR717_06640 [Prevotella sp.]|nr:hypothetical protein [Prevotella sp.]MDD5896700.1 hypothetical protein [Prevotellaceae bacterium]